MNHIDGNVQNNNINNLEWCTLSENILHAFNTLNHKRSKESYRKASKKLWKAIIDNNDNKIYPSIKAYAKEKNKKYNSVVRKLNRYMHNDLNIDYIQQ